jgi:hypothetical protein
VVAVLQVAAGDGDVVVVADAIAPRRNVTSDELA